MRQLRTLQCIVGSYMLYNLNSWLRNVNVSFSILRFTKVIKYNESCKIRIENKYIVTLD